MDQLKPIRTHLWCSKYSNFDEVHSRFDSCGSLPQNNNHDLCVTVFLAQSEPSDDWTTWAGSEPVSLSTVTDLSLWDPL